MEEQQTSAKNWYDKIYKKILILPAVMILFSMIYLIYFNAQNGDIIYKDVSLTGGTSITIFDSGINTGELKSALSEKFSDLSIKKLSEFRTGRQKGIIIETKADISEIRPLIEDYLGYALTQDNSSIEFSGSNLSAGFYNQLRLAIILAFVLMAVVVFFTFKTFVPSFTVILCVFTDIIMTLTVVDLLGFRLSVAGVIAFLMLIGYSVDTDILLTTRLIKRKEGNTNEKIYSSFKTGITMTLTSIAAIGASLFIISGISEVLRQIFSIVLIGLLFDMFNTWITNASILKWYVEIKGGTQ